MGTRAAPVASPETPNHSPKRNWTPGPASARFIKKHRIKVSMYLTLLEGHRDSNLQTADFRNLHLSKTFVLFALLIHFQLFKGKSGSPSPSRSRSHSVSLPPSRLPAHLPGDLGRPGFTWRFRLKTGAGLICTGTVISTQPGHFDLF